MYGSRVLGCHTKNSDYDCMAIISDLRQYHGMFGYCLNKFWPSCHSFMKDGVEIGYMTVSRDYFQKETEGRLESLLGKEYVSGRLHKPVLVYSEEEDFINARIRNARLRGARLSVLTMPNETFSLDEFVYCMMKLSYDMDIRREDPKKIQKILDSAGDVLRGIYSEILDELADENLVSKTADGYVRSVSPEMQAGAVKYVAGMKFKSGLINLKHLLTNRRSAAIIVKKIAKSIRSPQSLKTN
ncbi:phosphatidate cytidylyltransferase [Candidatus Woesearchaeota archaeon]|nr:phosphatidate cytidylyltransferase [Candidatus Woesearchaeota archaeon]